MDHPKKQIPHVIHLLAEGSPAEQEKALNTYFLPDASFIHPLCRVPSFDSIALPLLGEINSRWVIWMIYRWYKILSPTIILEVECSEYNQSTQMLFVSIRQIFSLFFVPFYKADVRLTTRLALDYNEKTKKYLIKSQEDLYQSSEVVKFFWPGGDLFVWLFQVTAMLMCVVGALALAPLTWLEQRRSLKANIDKLQ